jgi:hypothetical protein
MPMRSGHRTPSTKNWDRSNPGVERSATEVLEKKHSLHVAAKPRLTLFSANPMEAALAVAGGKHRRAGWRHAG